MDDFANKLGIPDWEFRLVFGRTRIDYDVGKEETNRAKHGYSLESACQLFERMLLPISPTPPCCTSTAFLEGEEVRHTHMSVDDSGKVIFVVHHHAL